MATTNAAVVSPRRFGTILVARPQSQRPSELEVLLREHSHKMRVLSSPAKLSGAHMVFEKSIALRIYYPHDIAILDDQQEGTDDGTDGIFDFCMAFQWPVVFLVVPNDHVADAYRAGSFVDRVMTMGYLENVAADKAPPRLMIVANTTQLLAAFFAFADDVASTERREKRAQIVRSMQSAVTDQKCVAAAIRNLLAPPRCPVGEADIVLSGLGNLHDIVRNCTMLGHAFGDNDDGDNELDKLPIDRRTKDILKAFFTECLANGDWLPNAAAVAGTITAPLAAAVPPAFHAAPLHTYQYELSPSETNNSHQFGCGIQAPPVPHPSALYPLMQDPSVQHATYHANYMPRGGMMMQIPATMPDASRAPPHLSPPLHTYRPPIPAPPQVHYSHQPLPRPRMDASFDPRIQSSRNRQPNRPPTGRPTYHR